MSPTIERGAHSTARQPTSGFSWSKVRHGLRSEAARPVVGLHRLTIIDDFNAQDASETGGAVSAIFALGTRHNARTEHPHLEGRARAPIGTSVLSLGGGVREMMLLVNASTAGTRALGGRSVPG
jgi:hypothetical protein